MEGYVPSLHPCFVEGKAGEVRQRDQNTKKRKITKHRISRFADTLEAWTFDEERAKGVEYNVGKF